MEGDGWPRFRARPSQATDFRQEKRESGVTRLPLFELCSRWCGKDRSGSSLGGRPWKIVLIRRLRPSCRPTHICGRACHRGIGPGRRRLRLEEHTSELQSLMRISYTVFRLTKKTKLEDYT